jgi:hypothetical protein
VRISLLGTEGDSSKVEEKVFLPGKTWPIAIFAQRESFKSRQIGPNQTEVLTSTSSRVKRVCDSNGTGAIAIYAENACYFRLMEGVKVKRDACCPIADTGKNRSAKRGHIGQKRPDRPREARWAKRGQIGQKRPDRPKEARSAKRGQMGQKEAR